MELRPAESGLDGLPGRKSAVDCEQWAVESGWTYARCSLWAISDLYVQIAATAMPGRHT